MESFGSTLAAMIERDKFTQTSFASKIGVSQGRVGQLVKGTYRNTAYSTLETVMSGFPDIADKEAIYAAWQAEFAPTPAGSVQLDPASSDAVLSFLSSAPRLVESGRNSEVTTTLGETWGVLRNNDGRFELAMQVAEALFDAYTAVGNHYGAILIAREIQQLAEDVGDKQWIASGLWREVVAARPVSPKSQFEPGSATEFAWEFIGQWSPRSDLESRAKAGVVRALVRDTSLAAWDVARSDNAGKDTVERWLPKLVVSIQGCDSKGDVMLGLEVQARLHVVCGNADRARWSLEEARSHIPPGDRTTSMKADVTEIRLMALEGKDAEAEEQIAASIEEAERLSLLHYRSELLREQRALMLRQRSRFRLP